MPPMLNNTSCSKVLTFSILILYLENLEILHEFFLNFVYVKKMFDIIFFGECITTYDQLGNRQQI